MFQALSSLSTMGSYATFPLTDRDIVVFGGTDAELCLTDAVGEPLDINILGDGGSVTYVGPSPMHRDQYDRLAAAAWAEGINAYLRAIHPHNPQS
jgi:hypothetical protein